MSGGEAPVGSIPAEAMPALRALADRLIPAGEAMPAAGSVLDPALLARVLEELPDLAEPTLEALRLVEGVAGEEWLARLTDADPGALAAAGEVIAAAYFLAPEVAERLGYRRREAVPVEPESGLEELTAPVLARGWPPAVGPAPERH